MCKKHFRSLRRKTLTKRIQVLALLVAAGALLAVPAIGQASHKAGHTPGSKSKRCKKPTVNKGFVVKGTWVAYTADNPATEANEGTVTITVTKANRHARVSGELTDANPMLAGTQYTVPTTDAGGFKVTLSEYEAGETPGANDRVRISGKVAVTKKKCASAEQDTVAERYGAVNVKKVAFTEVD
jgi:hypothetical protein